MPGDWFPSLPFRVHDPAAWDRARALLWRMTTQAQRKTIHSSDPPYIELTGGVTGATYKWDFWYGGLDCELGHLCVAPRSYRGEDLNIPGRGVAILTAVQSNYEITVIRTAVWTPDPIIDKLWGLYRIYNPKLLDPVRGYWADDHAYFHKGSAVREEDVPIELRVR